MIMDFLQPQTFGERQLLLHQVQLLKAQLREQEARQKQSAAFYATVIASVQSLKAYKCEHCIIRHEQQRESAQQQQRRDEAQVESMQRQLAAAARENRQTKIKFERALLKIQSELSQAQFENKELRRKLAATLDELVSARSDRGRGEEPERGSVGNRNSYQELKVMVGALLKAKNKLEEGDNDLTSLHEISRISSF